MKWINAAIACEGCHSEMVSNVALQRGFHLCWICNGSRARAAADAALEARLGKE